MYWREYTCSEPAYRTFSEGSEIDALKVGLVYKKKQQEGLWWWANCASGISNKATIRHFYTRKLRKAWEHALNEKGYASDGSRRVEGDGIKGLTGSLQLLGIARVADAPWDEVKEQCASVLDEVTRLHARPLQAREKQKPVDHQRRPPSKAKSKSGARRVAIGAHSSNSPPRSTSW
jgi:hypothetical protein